jgi:hypothetical protein
MNTPNITISQDKNTICLVFGFYLKAMQLTTFFYIWWKKGMRSIASHTLVCEGICLSKINYYGKL